MQRALGSLLGGRYRLGDPIGRGGMGEVLEAVDERLGRPVAVKLLHHHLGDRDDLRRRFETEATTAASLHHPNVVTIFDTGEDDGTQYIVMERLPGTSLADAIKKGPVDEAWLRPIAVEVLAAAAAAHAAGIVHRDLKPANILLCEGLPGEARGGDSGGAGPRCKVADFGIAKLMQGPSTDTTTNMIGTPAYLAPEQAHGQAGPQSDLYALGVVLYEALTGQRPDAKPVPLRVLRPDVSPAFAAAVHRAMATNLNRRFATAEQMSAALVGRSEAPRVVRAAAATGAPTVANPTATQALTSPTPHPPRQRFPWLVVAATAVALAGVLATAAFSSPKKNPEAPPTLVEEMRALAPRLGTEDGSMAPEAGRRLLAVADAAASRQGGGPATDLLADVLEWRQTRQLGPTATSKLTALLVRVPGVNTSTTTLPPPTTAEPESDRGKGKGGDKKDDD